MDLQWTGSPAGACWAVVKLGTTHRTGDSRILESAREEAEAWLAKDPDLTAPASRRLRAILEDRWAGRLELARVG
jgi:hypothetical protein